jgi:transcription-repair coupling factor (superfamily II helicase)
MRDLDIRGAGNLLGGEQSGFISEIGFDMYHKILDEAITELKEDEFSELFKDKKISIQSRDCLVDTHIEMLIPDEYVSNIAERLSLYRELSEISKEEDLVKFAERLIDRFGALPEQTENLLKSVRIKWMGKKMGFEKIMIQPDLMRLYFPSNQSSHFYQSDLFPNLMSYIASNPLLFELKQSSKTLILTCKAIKSISQAYMRLCGIEEAVYEHFVLDKI